MQLAWPWVGLGVLLGMAWLLPGRQSRKDRPDQPPPPEALSARRDLGALLRALAKARHPRQRGETLESLGQRLESRLPTDCYRHVALALTAYQEVRFGRYPFDHPRQQALRAALDPVRELADRDDAPPTDASSPA